MNVYMALITYAILLLLVQDAVLSINSASGFMSAHSAGVFPRFNCNKIDDTFSNSQTRRINTKNRLQDLRIAMRKKDLVRGPSLDAYIVTSEDEHQSEIISSRDQRLKFISGFSGSPGEAVVTHTSAALWTDSRYIKQADEELGCYWNIMDSSIPKVYIAAEWLKKHLTGSFRVGADPKLISHHVWLALENELAKRNISLIPTWTNLVDHIWTKNRPKYSKNSTFVHALQYAGETWMTKVNNVRERLKSLGAEAQVVTALDEIAWLLNIRGRNALYFPVVRAYVLLTLEDIDMYVQGGYSSLSNTVRLHLRSDSCFDAYCVRIHPYEQFWTDLKTKSQAWPKVLIPSEISFNPGASQAIYMTVSPEKRLSRPSPIMFLKAVKNKVEIEGMRRAHIRDAAAICLFMAYVQEMFNYGNSLNETEIAEAIDKFRVDQPLSVGASFRTIAGYGPNGAIPHYRPHASSALNIEQDSTLVVDSGGQYLDGTTDVTRTFHFGQPTKRQREAYTRVLAAQLSLSKLVFPMHVDFSDIDAIARANLWTVGMDYHHNTGHGIGSFLSVHESPISIHYNNEFTSNLQVGNFFSIEPGYYKKGDFGVRLENIVEVVNVKTKFNVSGPYLGFRPATLVPYEPSLINADLLTPDLRRILNEYNARIRTEVGPELKKTTNMKGFRWMMDKTGYVPEWTPPKNCGLSIGVSKTLQIILVVIIYFIKIL